MAKAFFRLLPFLFSMIFCTTVDGQNTLEEKMVHANELIANGEKEKGYFLLLSIEDECTSFDNDTIIAYFYEIKAFAQYCMEKYEECIISCDKSINHFELCRFRPYEYLEAFRMTAHSYYRIKEFDKAETFYRKCLFRTNNTNVNTSDQFLADLYLNLGNLYKTKGDSILAEDCFNKLKQLDVSKPVAIEDWNYLDWENSYWDKVDSLTKSKMFLEAIDVYTEMIEGIRAKRGKEKTYMLATFSKALLLTRGLDRYDDALPLLKDVIDCGKDSSNYDNSFCGACCEMALYYAYKGEFSALDSFIPEARTYLIKANNEIYPPHSIYRFAGNGAYWTHNYEMAIKYYTQYLDPINKKERGTSYEEIINQLSVSYILANKPKEAKLLLIDYLKTDEKRLESENISTLANIYHNLGRAYMLDNSKSEALKYLNKSKDLQIQIWGEVFEKTRLYIEECMSK